MGYCSTFAGLLWNISHTFFVHLVTTSISITISVYPSNLTPWIEQSGLVRIMSDYSENHRGKSPSLSGITCLHHHTSKPQRSLELWMPTVDTKTRPSLGQTYHTVDQQKVQQCKIEQFRLSIHWLDYSFCNESQIMRSGCSLRIIQSFLS